MQSRPSAARTFIASYLAVLGSVLTTILAVVYGYFLMDGGDDGSMYGIAIIAAPVFVFPPSLVVWLALLHARWVKSSGPVTAFMFVVGLGALPWAAIGITLLFLAT